jgi:hypothetical protein
LPPFALRETESCANAEPARTTKANTLIERAVMQHFSAV